jgi:phospholipid/cholesterol/gamma-HCH transport system substrate-binding protein
VKEKRNTIIRLGIFALTGLVLMIITLFLIGNNQQLFSSKFILTTHFKNVGGLKAGNNVRYAGIIIGTVKNVRFINDTTVEVSLQVDEKMKTIIRKNTLSSIGTDGLMGDKIINLSPQGGESALAVDGDLLPSYQPIDIDDIIATLSSTNKNILLISEGLKETVEKLNNSKGLWKLLGDENLGKSLNRTANNLEKVTANAYAMTNDLREVMADVKSGKGTAGMILRDTAMAASLQSSISELEQVALQANKLAATLDTITRNISMDIDQGSGMANLILKDTAITGKVNRTLDNVEKGTAAFNENMEAMKHNFLFKGYFKKQEKEKAKEQKSQTTH